jgi:prephenate dehydrogenase
MSAGPGGEGGIPKTVVVVGLGLMGGSLCRALKAMEAPPRVVGLDRSPVAGERALEVGAIDRFESDFPVGLEEADLVIYAVPLGEAVTLIPRHANRFGAETLVTDVVSLKGPLLEAAAGGGLSDRFIGAHPICGGEGSGFDAGSPELFSGATVWLAASDQASQQAKAAVESFWSVVGGVPQWIDAAEHDRRMAWVSHLPQLVANALAGALDAAGCTRSELGPGGRDMTRLAGSNPEIWRDLLEVSAPVTGTGLTSVSHALNALADLLARREVDRISEFMERTRRWSQGD